MVLSRAHIPLLVARRGLHLYSDDAGQSLQVCARLAGHLPQAPFRADAYRGLPRDGSPQAVFVVLAQSADGHHPPLLHAQGGHARAAAASALVLLLPLDLRLARDDCRALRGAHGDGARAEPRRRAQQAGGRTAQRLALLPELHGPGLVVGDLRAAAAHELPEVRLPPLRSQPGPPLRQAALRARGRGLLRRGRPHGHGRAHVLHGPRLLHMQPFDPRRRLRLLRPGALDLRLPPGARGGPEAGPRRARLLRVAAAGALLPLPLRAAHGERAAEALRGDRQHPQLEVAAWAPPGGRPCVPGRVLGLEAAAQPRLGRAAFGGGRARQPREGGGRGEGDGGAEALRALRADGVQPGAAARGRREGRHDQGACAGGKPLLRGARRRALRRGPRGLRDAVHLPRHGRGRGGGGPEPRRGGPDRAGFRDLRLGGCSRGVRPSLRGHHHAASAARLGGAAFAGKEPSARSPPRRLIDLGRPHGRRLHTLWQAD
mmetsp:Transcript_30638/g.95201  ORF Transcript_30638/g.95201 Transcript_30638/m.95201 type:complete len:487 (+) Transcript_30638:898-2358(+)